MSRILIIEPYKLLQHAFAVALFAEHELAIFERIPEAAGGIDVGIIDAAALRERGSLSEAELRMIRAWRLPIVWLDVDEQSEAPAVNKVARAKMPLDKEALKQALIAVQSSSGRSQLTSSETIPVKGPRPKKPKIRQPGRGSAGGQSNRNIIDLVDVVEEVAADDRWMEPLRKE